MNRKKRLLTILIGAITTLLVVVGAIVLNRPGEQASVAQPSKVSTTKSSVPNALSSMKSMMPSRSLQCSTAKEGFVPVRYTIEGSLKVDEAVIPVGEDSDGNIGAPPSAEKRAAAWWKNGPQPGPTEGKTVLSIHTYRHGGALGNELYEGGESRLQKGDVIKLYGANGEVACYEFTEAQKVMVDDYDPDSDIMVDREGAPEIVMIICWDFDNKVDDSSGADPWKSRVFFHGTLF